MTVAHFVGTQNVSGYANITVDSTAGFPNAGWVKIGNSPAYYSYSGKTPTVFLLMTGPPWQFPTGTTITFVQAAAPLPSLVTEVRNDGVGNLATISVEGQKGDTAVVVLCATERPGVSPQLTYQDPALQQMQQMSSGWWGDTGINGIRLIQGTYRFMVDKTQTFNWNLNHNYLWRFDAVVYRGLGALPQYGVASGFGSEGSYAYDLYFGPNPLGPQPYLMLDIVGAKTSGSTIVYPDPDPGVMTSFQDFGPVPFWVSSKGGSATYPVNISFHDNNLPTQPGDFLLLQAWSSTGGTTPLPSGWTSLYSNTDPQCLVAYKVWHEGDPTTVGVGEQMTVSFYRGVHPTNPIDAVRTLSPAEGSPGSDYIPISYFNAMLIECLFVTTTSTSYYINNPSNRVGTYGAYQDRGFQDRYGVGSYGPIRMAMVDRPAWVGTPFAPVWTWGGGYPISSLGGTSAQVAVALRPAVPAVGQASWDSSETIVGAGPRKSTVAFFERSPTDMRSYLVEDAAGAPSGGSWIINSLALTPPEPQLPFGPMVDASEASIIVGITGIDGGIGSYVGDGAPRDAWLATFPESVRKHFVSFPDYPIPENMSVLMFLDDLGNTIALHPYVAGRDTWGYGPQVSPDGTNFVIPPWFGNDVVCVDLAGHVLWSLPNYDIDTPLCYSADGNFIYAYCFDGPSLMVLDAKTGDLVDNKPFSGTGRDMPWQPQLTPNGLLIGAVYDNSYPSGIYVTDPATGDNEPWLLWADVEDQLPFTRIGSNPLIQGNWGLDVHPTGDGIVVATRHAYPIGALVEISWDKQVTNTYQLGDWARNGNRGTEMIECCYSQDGNYLYATDDLGGLLFRFARGPGNVGGDAPYMNLSYATRADWEADGSPDGLHSGQADDHAAWYLSTTGVDTRKPTTTRPTNTISRSVVGVRGRW